MADSTLQGTLQTGTKQKKVLSEAEIARRRAMMDMLDAGEDPGFVKFNHVRHAFDEEEANDAIDTYYRAKGQPNPLGTKPSENVDLSGASALERQSIADMDSTIQMAKEAQTMAKFSSTGPVAGRGQQLESMLPGGGDKEFNELNAKLSNIKSNFMKALSGAAVSEQEVKRLSKFLPDVTDQEEVIQVKLEALASELENRKKNTLKSLGIDTEGVAPTRSAVVTMTDQDREAVEWLKSNPDHEEAPRIRALVEQRLGSGALESDVAPEEEKTQESTLVDPDTGEIKSSGFFDDVSESFTKRTDANAEILNSTDSTASKVLQVTGQNLGFFADTAGSAVINALKVVTPKFIEKAAGEKIDELVSAGMGSEAAQKIVSSWDEFSKTNPEMARNIAAGGNIANFFAIGMGGGAAATATKRGVATAASGVGSALEKSGKAGIQATKEKFVQDLVMPKVDKKVGTEQVGRTTEKGFGPFKKNVVQPNQQELQMAKEVSAIEGVSPKNTLQKNFTIIQDRVSQEADDLITAVSQNDFIIPRKEVVSRLNKAKTGLAESPLLVGDARKTADKLLAGAQRFINENAGTGSGLLKARKDYDAWVLKQKPSAFDSAKTDAFTIANREVRNVMNTILDEKAPNAQVKESLRRQSSMLRAMDNIRPKAYEEASSAFGRAFQRLGAKIGTKNKVVQGLTALGIGGALGGAATFATPVALTAAAGYGVYKGVRALMSPSLRKGLGKVLKESGHLLDPEDKKLFEGLLEPGRVKTVIDKAKSIRPGMNIQDISPRGTEARKKLSELTSKMSSAKNETIRNRYKKAIQDLIDRENSGNLGEGAIPKIAGQKTLATPVYRAGKLDIGKITNQGISFTTDKGYAEIFGKARGRFVEQHGIKSDAKILKDIPKKFYDVGKDGTFTTKDGAKLEFSGKDEFQNIVDYARKNGYDAVDLGKFGESEIRVLNPKVINKSSGRKHIKSN